MGYLELASSLCTGGYFFGGMIASLKALAMRILTTVFAGISIS